MLKKFGAVCLAAVLLLTGCTLRPQENGSKVQSISRPAVESAELQFTHPVAGDTVAVFDTSAGVFRAVLFPEKAPQACDNFIGLVQQGYYNGLTVSRVENQFVVEAGQGADGKGSTIWKGSRYPVEASDSLHHYAGALCMGVDASGECASVFYVVQTLPGVPVGDPGTGGQDERLGLPCRGGGRLPDRRRRTLSGLHRYRVRAGV